MLDGNTNDSSRLTHYCERKLPSPVTTSKNIGGVRIRKTNYLGVNITFNYTFIDDDPSQFLDKNHFTDKRCERIYNSEFFIGIYSPISNLFCKRYFNNSDNYRNVLAISHLKINPSTNCSKDRLELDDLNSREKQQICSGLNHSQTFVTSELLLTFTTTGVNFDRRFSANVYQVEIAENLTKLTCFPNMTVNSPKCYGETGDCLNATCLHGDNDIIVYATNTFGKRLKNAVGLEVFQFLALIRR